MVDRKLLAFIWRRIRTRVMPDMVRLNGVPTSLVAVILGLNLGSWFARLESGDLLWALNLAIVLFLLKILIRRAKE